MPSNTWDTSYAFIIGDGTPIHTGDDMECQEMYLVLWNSKYVIFDIEGMLGLEQGVLSFNISHTRCIYSPYALNYSQFVNYLKMLTRKCMGNVKHNAV